MDADKGQLRYASVLTLLIVCALFLAAHIFCLYVASPQRFPINKIKISATYQHISHQQLEEVLENYANASFFSFPVARLHIQLMELEWINEVLVERIWPDTLKITLVEKIPVAIWNNAMLTEEGELFNEGGEVGDASLPHLKGPANQHQQVLQVYKKLSKILTIYGLHAVALQWRENQAWELTLSNGILLRLGKRFLKIRINRFCKAYPAVFAGAFSAGALHMASVDLRYPRGMAVQWNK